MTPASWIAHPCKPRELVMRREPNIVAANSTSVRTGISRRLMTPAERLGRP
jgi:hypothetical protein